MEDELDFGRGVSFLAGGEDLLLDFDCPAEGLFGEELGDCEGCEVVLEQLSSEALGSGEVRESEVEREHSRVLSARRDFE